MPRYRDAIARLAAGFGHVNRRRTFDRLCFGHAQLSGAQPKSRSRRHHTQRDDRAFDAAGHGQAQRGHKLAPGEHAANFRGACTNLHQLGIAEHSGLRRIGDVMGLPRAGLSRRFGMHVMRRLDQALGIEPEPISPAGAPLHFAARLSFPDPIGLTEDITAGIDRLLPVLCDRLRTQGRGARRARLELSRVDGDTQVIEVGLARPADQPHALRQLFTMKLDGVDVGFGIDRLRVHAVVTEPLHAKTHKGGWAVAEDAKTRADGQGMADLIARLGARVGLEAIQRPAPADSHIPEKTAKRLAAAWSEPHPAGEWPKPTRPRPLTLFPPEPVQAPDAPQIPDSFRWRGRTFQTQGAQGPERIAPEWWLDDPAWRSGVRDYWRITTQDGARLWLYYAHGAGLSSGWFAQGDFN